MNNQLRHFVLWTNQFQLKLGLVANGLHMRYLNNMFGRKFLTIVFPLTDLAGKKPHTNQGTWEQKMLVNNSKIPLLLRVGDT